MNDAIDTLLERYQLESIQDYENAVKEIVQELALLGLWRAGFYEKAAFYGGTALRIFYKLPRFSEDLDFSLLEPQKQFSLSSYLEAVKKELAAFGFEVDVEEKVKQQKSAIESAFIKGETKVNLLRIGLPDSLAARIPKLQKVKVKLEVDTNPPAGAETEMKTLLTPIPFQVRLFSKPDLFAGKVHALLCRNWKNRVKGRDFYDFLWYLGQEIPCHLAHLKERMVQSGHWDSEQKLDHVALVTQLSARFSKVDFSQAREDARPFITDPDSLKLWSVDFFNSVLDQVQTG